MQITKADEERLMALVQMHLRRFRSHEQFDDLLSEAYLRAWQSLGELCRSGAYPLGVAMEAAAKSARWAAADFLRSSRNEYRRETRRHGLKVAVERPESLDAIIASWDAEDRNGSEAGGFEPCDDPPLVADFSPAVVDRVAFAQVMFLARVQMERDEWTLVVDYLEGSRPLPELARLLGLTVAEAEAKRGQGLAVVQTVLENE